MIDGMVDCVFRWTGVVVLVSQSTGYLNLALQAADLYACAHTKSIHHHRGAPTATTTPTSRKPVTEQRRRRRVQQEEEG